MRPRRNVGEGCYNRVAPESIVGPTSLKAAYRIDIPARMVKWSPLRRRPRQSSPPSPAPRAGRVRVLYIMGAGRSGSTVVGAALARSVGGVFAGELDAYPRRCGVPGRPAPDVQQFWARVRASLNDCHRTGDPAWHGLFDHPRGLLSGLRPGRRQMLGEYVRFNNSLYKIVANLASTDTVVDSSHYPLRRLRLTNLPEETEVFTIHLVRNPQSCVASLRTGRTPKSLLSANAYLWIVGVLSEVAYRRLPANRRVRLRFEDFLTAPESVISELASAWGLRTEPIDFQSIPTGTPFAGNRLIHQPVISLRPLDDSATPSSRDWLTRILQQPWFSRYGYHPRPP